MTCHEENADDFFVSPIGLKRYHKSQLAAHKKVCPFFQKRVGTI
jgi:hypothetical protein